jgi:hypothetical protein
MRTSRGLVASVLVLLLLLPLAGCQGDADTDEESSSPSTSEPPAGMDESLRDAALELVAAREQALQDGDKEAFLATVDPDAKDFATTQERWWDNVARLPATDFALELGDEGVMTRVSGDGDLQLPIDFTMRLDGYDQHPVTQPLVYTFVGDEDEVLLASDRNVQIDAFTGWLPAPWDVTEITVEESDDVLAVFDDETQRDADDLLADIVGARDAITPLLPEWSGSVVAYDISDLDAMDRMSLMDIRSTGGVAFPVLARPGSRRVAAYRFAVNPDSTGSGADRELLFRHELVHVALGDRDDWSPTWLTEGTAEYVARRAAYGVVARKAIAQQLLGGRDGAALEVGRDFYQGDAALNYEIAALVCDYLADTRGQDVLWDLMDAFDGKRNLSTAGDVDDLVRRELGVTSEQLRDEALAWAGVA